MITYDTLRGNESENRTYRNSWSEHDLSEHVFCRGMNNLSAVEKETEKIQAWPGIEP